MLLYHIKKIIDLFFEFWQKLANCFYSFGKIIVLSQLKNKIPVVNGKEIVVIGNAPSFGEDYASNPDFFHTKDLMCVNNFPSTERYEVLKPRYVFFLDGIYFFPEESMKPFAKKTLDSIKEKTTWKVTVFVPQLYRKATYIKTIAAANPNVTICYFNYTILEGFDWLIHFCYKNNLGMPMCKNVVLAAIFASLNMRYKKIYLTGVDNTFFKDIFVSPENDLFVNMVYFYNNNGEKATGHFYNNLETSDRMDVTDFFQWCYLNFKGYKNLKRYGDYMNSEIINTTIKSYIDAFEKKSVSELK